MEEIILPFGYGSPLLLKCNPAFLPPPPPPPNHHLFSHLSTKKFVSSGFMSNSWNKFVLNEN